tara:strand:+ start:192 stop:632 length:441 start_codon:yes stop_codon:yes gene_type:complete
MKNYLFAPFKDNREKKEYFQWVKTKNDCRLFVGRLESTYDAIIEELQAENYHDEIKDLHKERDDLFKACKLLKADNKELKAENESLQDQLKECVKDYDNDIKASYDLDDKHVEIIKRLETEKDALLVANGELLQSNIKLRSDSYDD